MGEAVHWEVLNHVGVVTLDRAPVNAINRAMVDELDAVLAVAEAESDLRAVVIKGAGSKAFAAGADISEMQEMGAVEARRMAAHGQAVFARLSSLSVPVIAAVQGFCLGGGCELAMAADIILAGEKARFGQPEVKLGVTPGFGGTQRLTRRVGLSVALDLVLTGRMIDADEAVRVGLASRKVEGDVESAALELAGQIATLGPVAVALAKRAIHDNADTDLTTALAAEAAAFGLCFATEDQREGMAAFLDKRKASFTGR